MSPPNKQDGFMHKFAVSLFSSARGTSPSIITAALSDFGKDPDTVDVDVDDTDALKRAKFDGQAWSPAEFIGSRGKKNAKTASVLGLDFDKGSDGEEGLSSVDVDSLRAALTAKGLAYAIHDSFSSGGFHPRRKIRVVVPITAPVSPIEYEGLWDSVASWLPVQPDRTRRGCDGIFFSPRVPLAWAPLYKSEVAEGRALFGGGGGVNSGPKSKKGWLDRLMTITENKDDCLLRAATFFGAESVRTGESVDGVEALLLGALAANTKAGNIRDINHATETVKKGLAFGIESETAKGTRATAARELGLVLDDKGKIVACQANVNTFCEEFIPCLGFDTRAGRLVVKLPPVWGVVGELPRSLSDADEVMIVSHLARCRGYTGATVNQVASGMLAAGAGATRFDPVRTYLDELDEIDEVAAREIAETWLIRYAGADDSVYVRAVSMRWLISAVARVYSPGCVCREVLTLVGPQNKGKSSLLRNLCQDVSWFRDDLSFRNEDSPKRGLLGKWIVELAEIDKLTRADKHGDLKAFIGSTVDTFDVKYQRHESSVPRMSVIAATTNKERPFSDETGNSRFNVINLGDGEIDHGGVGMARDALWGAARSLYRAGVPWHLLGEERQLAAAVQAEGLYLSDFDEWLENFLEGLPLNGEIDWTRAAVNPDKTFQFVTLDYVKESSKRSGFNTHSNQIGVAMKRLGWTLKQSRVDGAKARRWYPQ